MPAEERSAYCRYGCGVFLGQQHAESCTRSAACVAGDVVQLGGLHEPAVIQGDDRALTAFFYLLLRDRLSAGVVEHLVLDAEATALMEEATLSNPMLAGYASNLANRLRPIKDGKQQVDS